MQCFNPGCCRPISINPYCPSEARADDEAIDTGKAPYPCEDTPPSNLRSSLTIQALPPNISRSLVSQAAPKSFSD